MRRIAVLLVTALAGSACHKDTVATANVPGPPASTVDLDALWAQAPTGVQFALVVSPRAITMLEHAWRDVHAYLRTLQVFAPLEKELARSFADIGRTADATLADFGLGPAKGAALFVLDHADTVTILPIVDRAKFVAASKSTTDGDTDRVGTAYCKMIHDYYACADHKDRLDQIGGGEDVAAQALKAADTRGDIESIVMAPVQAAVVLQLARGTVVARGTVNRLPPLPPLGPAAQPHVSELARTGGFAVVDLSQALANLPHLPLAAGVFLDDVAHALRGRVQVMTSTGELAVDASIPLRDPAPIQKLLEHCAEIQPLGALGAKFADGTCHMPIPQAWIAFDARVEADTLHVTSKSETPAPAVAADALGEELASQPWTMAFWGRGTMFAPNKLEGIVLAQINAAGGGTSESGGPMLAALRAFAMLDELGVGVRVEGPSAAPYGGAARPGGAGPSDGNKLRFVAGARTAWANPDDVAAKITAITVDDLASGRGGEAGKAIADAAPSSPFARDFTAGYSGLVVPTAIVGALAAVAIPAFENYMRRSKQSEATQHLNTLGNDLRTYYAQHHTLPVGDAGPTPAVATCCGTRVVGDEIDNRCDSNPSLWTGDKIWGALGFSVDQPTYYRISYHSDGKTFSAKAIGDLDCDGNVAIFEMHGEAVAGDVSDVSFKIDPPAPGVY